MVSALDKQILMVRQDVPRMLETLFDMIDGKIDASGVVEMPSALVYDDPLCKY
jgi:hypothetical protein